MFLFLKENITCDDVCNKYLLNSLPNDKILDQSKFKAFVDDKINVTKILKSVQGREETLWGKEKILVTSIFFFSHNVFKRFLFRVVKSLGCVVKS